MPPVTEKRESVSFNDHIAHYIQADSRFMEGIRKGIEDCDAGRVQTWAEIKKELNIK
jgi:predicted transcriptional regulator